MSTRRNGAILGFMLLGPLFVFFNTSLPQLDEPQKQARIAHLQTAFSGEFDVPHITPSELLASAGDYVIVDVRAPEEQAVSMIPQAIDWEEFNAHRDQYKDQAIVNYCTIGYRSGIFAQDLRHAGFDAYNLTGGIVNWTHHGGPLTNASGPTKRLHVYGKNWNLAAAGYQAEW